MRVTPDEANKWYGTLEMLTKTKLGVGVLVFIFCSVISYLYTKDIRTQLEEKKKTIKEYIIKVDEVRKEESDNCIKQQKEYFQFYMDQQNVIMQNNNNRSQLEELREMTEQNRRLLNQIKND